MGIKWRQVETEADAELYVNTLLRNQPQYHSTAKLVIKHVASPYGEFRYVIGVDVDRQETAVFRIVMMTDPPTADQYGVDGPNWLTAFGRYVEPTCEEIVNQAGGVCDFAEVPLDLGADARRAAGRLLSAELDKLTAGRVRASERPESTAKRKLYRITGHA